MPGGKIGGGGHSSGGGHIGGGHFGGGGFRPSGSSRPSGGSRPSGSYYSGHSSGSGDSSFWQGMLFGSMMSNQNRPGSYQGTPHNTGYNTYPSPQPQQHQQTQQTTVAQRRSSGIGCLTIMLILFVFFAVLLLLPNISSNAPKSTVEREKLDSRYVTRTAFYEDKAGWITSSARLEKGLRYFYEKTGVQPFLYVVEDINGNTNPSNSEMDAYCAALYDELFEDEGHMLVVSYGYIGYWYYVGYSAETVLDAEALDIFETYVDHYADDLVYDQIDLDEFYANVFTDTADRIMQVTPNYRMHFLIAVVVLAILFFLYRWWRKIKEQKNKEAAQTAAILNANINDLANDPKLSDLEGKYDGYPAASAASGAATASGAEKAKDEPPSSGVFNRVDTYETAREQELKSPTLQELEDKYK